MSDPRPEPPEVPDYSDEPDTPDAIVEVTSLEEDEPIVLESGVDDPTTWPQPPEDWEIGRHVAQYKADPDVVFGKDDTKDELVQPPEKETPV